MYAPFDDIAIPCSGPPVRSPRLAEKALPAFLKAARTPLRIQTLSRAHTRSANEFSSHLTVTLTPALGLPTANPVAEGRFICCIQLL